MTTLATVYPDQTFPAAAEGAPSGLVGTIGVAIYDALTNTYPTPRTTVGIVENPSGSGVYYKASPPLTAPHDPGDYFVVWDTDNGDPVFAQDLLVVIAVPAPAPGPGGPCALWVTGQDILDNIGEVNDPPTAADLDPYAVMASELLYEMSGRQFAGACEMTVRPCRLGCGCWGDDWGILDSSWFWGYGSMGWGYGWGWWDANGTSCGCGCEARLQLAGYPVSSITEVVIGADVVDPATYELQQERWLARLWDDSTDPATPLFWPTCQNLNLPLGNPNTWGVTYRYGSAPPALGEQAATEMGWQLWLAQHNPGECQLSSGVTKVTRQGVTIERLLPLFGRDATGRIQATGLVVTDSFLAAYNPNGLRRRPAFWSPDRQYPRRVT